MPSLLVKYSGASPTEGVSDRPRVPGCRPLAGRLCAVLVTPSGARSVSLLSLPPPLPPSSCSSRLRASHVASPSWNHTRIHPIPVSFPRPCPCRGRQGPLGWGGGSCLAGVRVLINPPCAVQSPGWEAGSNGSPARTERPRGTRGACLGVQAVSWAQRGPGGFCPSGAGVCGTGATTAGLPADARLADNSNNRPLLLLLL